MGDVFPRTTFASRDPRALPLYVRAGMDAIWPNFFFQGDPRILPDPPAGFALDVVPLEEMARLERAWTGSDRTLELPYWPAAVDLRPFVVTLRGDPVATGLSRRRMNGKDHWLDHAAAAPGANAVPALMTALRLGGADATLTGAAVPGPSPLLRALLEAGWKIDDRDVFLASDPSVVDPQREIMNTGFL
jgi:hypothetical protein